MSLIWIIALVFALYLRTIRYNYVIDDMVRREGYLYNVPLTSPPADFYYTRPSVWYRLFMIGMHCVNVTVVYLLWGWAPALLYAVHPLCVWGTAWVTGNYYATTTYFVLISYYILHTFPNIWGMLAAMPIFAAALNSTVDSLPFPFLMLFSGNPWSLGLFIPLLTFLFGKKFKTGINIRLGFNVNKKHVVDTKFTWRRLLFMTVVTARYIYISFVPDKLGFFSPFAHRIKDDRVAYSKVHSANVEFWYSLMLCLIVFIAGMIINPFAILWFFAFILLHSQFILLGQVFAQRYVYIALIGLCVIVGQVFQSYPVVMAILTTILVIRTFIFIPVWRNIETVWRNDVETFPDFGLNYNNLAQFYMNENQWHIQHRVNEISWIMSKAMYLSGDEWEVHMNMACFWAGVGDIDRCLFETEESIKILKPLGGIALPMEKLTEQRDRLKAMIEKRNNEKTASIHTDPNKG